MRIIAFGCSLTYGQFLPNRNIQSWPAQLSNLTNTEVVNCGVPGASNREIQHIILNFNFKPNDLCITMWTNPYRWIIFNQTENIKLGSWQNTKRSNAFVEHFWQEYDMSLDTYERANLINYYIPNNIQLISDNGFLGDVAPTWNKVDFYTDVDFHSIRKKYMPAEDGRHPGPDAYADLAISLQKKINKLSNIS